MTVSLVLALLAASARAQEAKPVAKVAPGVFISRVSAPATGADVVRGRSEPKRVLESKQRSGPSARIVGGSPTTISEWPWQAALLFDSRIVPEDGFQRQFCGGSLVAPNIVISAAHCAFDVVNRDGAFDPIFFDVVTGRTVLSSNQGQEIGVSSYFYFTDAQGNPLIGGNVFPRWDAIVIELSSNSTSPTIKLAGPNEEAAWAPGRIAFATGWGALNEGPPQVFPDDLQQVQLRMIADSTCADVFGSLFDRALMVCAGELAGGRDACDGDSGGPLVVPIDAGGFRLVGDTSFGIGCARPNIPGVYGRLADDPMLHGLAEMTEAISSVNIIGTCEEDEAALAKAERKFKKTKRKFNKAERKFKKAKTEKAKQKLKKSKRRLKQSKRRFKQAKKQVKAAC
ncbi:MAG TPA: serine protease [Solirubrobacterales bacterium]|nr:serine protease [Solirubrobacterales bacterium]